MEIQLVFALELAKKAAENDLNNRLAEALSDYREAIIALENILASSTDSFADDEPQPSSLSESQRLGIIEKRNLYIERVDTILASASHEISAVYSGRGFSSLTPHKELHAVSSLQNPLNASSYAEYLDQIALDDPGSLDPPEPRPSSNVNIAFWRMRLLQRTMTTGGYLTPRIHVPRQIWYQSGARLLSVEAKFSALETLYLANKDFVSLDITRDVKLIYSKLHDYENIIDTVKTNLLKKIKHELEEQPQGLLRKITQKLGLGSSKGDKIADLSTYIELLIRVFGSCQLFESWLNELEKSNDNLNSRSCIEKIKNIAEFYNSVIVAFVVKDFRNLVQRYLKKMGQELDA